MASTLKLYWPTSVKLVNNWPVQKLDERLPWAWAKQQAAYTLPA